MSRKNTFYFSHDYNARTDRKLIVLAMKHGMVGIGIFWCIVEMLYEEGGYMPMECERIAFELRTDKTLIENIISHSELFENNDETFWSNTILNRLNIRNEKSKKASDSAYQRWGNPNTNANAMRTQCEWNAIKERKGKEKEDSATEKKENLFGEETTIKKEYIQTNMFDAFWKIYPKKDGKGAALTAWEKLCNSNHKKNRPTWKEIKKAILAQNKTERWQEDIKFIPHASTWLNQTRWINDPTEMKTFSRTNFSNRPAYKEALGIRYYLNKDDGEYYHKSGEKYID